MHISKSFRQTFTAAAVIGVIHSALPLSVAEKTFYAGFWLGYLALVAFGFLAAREGRRYRYVFNLTFAFAGLWFFLGLLSFAFGFLQLASGLVDLPPNGPPNQAQIAFYGFLMSTVMFLPFSFAASGIGVLAARLFSRGPSGTPS